MFIPFLCCVIGRKMGWSDRIVVHCLHPLYLSATSPSLHTRRVYLMVRSKCVSSSSLELWSCWGGGHWRVRGLPLGVSFLLLLLPIKQLPRSATYYYIARRSNVGEGGVEARRKDLRFTLVFCPPYLSSLDALTPLRAIHRGVSRYDLGRRFENLVGAGPSKD